MMNKYTRFVATFVLLLTAFSMNAQSLKQEPLQLVKYHKNVDLPLTSAEKAMLEEVYADKLNEYILSRPNRLKSVKNILRNRVEVIQITEKDISSLKRLSEVPLFNHYNSNLTRDVVVNTNTFNPLKYEFNFYSRYGEYVRIDGTNKILKIKSQYDK